MRGATFCEKSIIKREIVSIHAPVRGATFSASLEVRPMTGFNPRTREGCDSKEHQRQYGEVVSIHAPVRGATDWEGYFVT